MDPSKSQQSAADPASTPLSCSRTRAHTWSGSGVSSGTFPPSVGHNPSEQSPHGGGSSSITGTKNYTDDEEEDVDITGDSRLIHHEKKSSTTKENEEDTATSNSRKLLEAIELLSDFLAFKNKTGCYAYLPDDIQLYYLNWTLPQKVFAFREQKIFDTQEEVENRLHELRQTYKNIKKKIVEFPTDPDEIKIFRFSDLVWSDDIDSTDNSSEETVAIRPSDSKDSSYDYEVSDRNGTNDSSKETGDEQVESNDQDPKDSKDPETNKDGSSDS